MGLADNLIRCEHLSIVALDERGQLAPQCSKPTSGSPVANRTRIEVSIPKRAFMRLVSEGLEIEGAFTATKLAAQRREASSPEEYLKLQLALGKHLDAGSVILETGGLRKIRWAMTGRRKRDGLRIIYYV